MAKYLLKRFKLFGVWVVLTHKKQINNNIITLLMKKLLLAFAIATASLVSFSSCTKEVMDPNSTRTYTYVYTIEPSAWKAITADRPTYELIIDEPDLDEVIFEDGIVSVAALFESHSNLYELLPGTIRDYHFTANYAVGSVAVYAEYRGTGAPVKPEKMLIKLGLTEGLVGN